MSDSSRPFTSGTVAAILAMMAATVGGCEEPVEDGIVSLWPTATAKAPISMDLDIALISEDVACVINSFDPRLYCVDGPRGIVETFGREGEGPGELRHPAFIERGPDGTVAVFELASAQMTSFRPDGTLVSETRIPVDFVGTDLQGDRLLGFQLAMLDRTRPEGQSRYVAAEVDASSGELLWKRDVADAVRLDCFSGLVGILNPAGGLVTTACEHELVFLDHWADAAATIVPSPVYVPAFPNDRDVDAYVERVTRIGGGMVHYSDARKEAYAAGYRAKPKKWYYGGGSSGLSFDGENRLWAATSQDRDDFSYFDVWVGKEYAGTVRIRDRLVGYDILGSTLVALVDRKPDRYGIAPRAIDWYDISEFVFRSDD